MLRSVYFAMLLLFTSLQKGLLSLNQIVMSDVVSSGVAYKVVLQHSSRRVTKHRFRGEFSYKDVVELLSYLWGGAKKLAIEYTDAEGDDILVLTEIEWRECVRLHVEQAQRDESGKPVAALPLHLRVRKAQTVASKKAAKSTGLTSGLAAASAVPVRPDDSEDEVDEQESCDEGAVEYVTPNGSIACGSEHQRPSQGASVASRCTESARLSCRRDEVAQSTTVDAEGSTEALNAVHFVPRLHLSAIRRPPRALGASSLDVSVEQSEHQHVLKLLSLLFECDAALELFADVPTHDMSSVVRRVRSDGDVHLDVKLDSLREAVVVRANKFMEDQQYAEALSLLEVGMLVFPRDSVLSYNAACACSLSTEPVKGLELLQNAVTQGYNDVNMILSDPDLNCVRGLDDFQQFLERNFPELMAEAAKVEASAAQPLLNPQTTDAGLPGAAQDEAAAAPVEVAAPVAVMPTLPQPTPRTGTMLTIFPSMTESEAHRLIELAKGNMNLAVQWKLGGQ